MANDLKQALFAKLTGDSTLGALLAAGTAGVYDSLAPQGATPPYVIFQQQAGTDAYTLTTRAMSTYVFQVKAVAQSSSAKTAGQIADRIDALLNDQPLTLSGARSVTYLRRDGELDYPETVPGGQVIRHVGGLYRIVLT